MLECRSSIKGRRPLRASQKLRGVGTRGRRRAAAETVKSGRLRRRGLGYKVRTGAEEGVRVRRRRGLDRVGRRAELRRPVPRGRRVRVPSIIACFARIEGRRVGDREAVVLHLQVVLYILFFESAYNLSYFVKLIVEKLNQLNHYFVET